jgi:hypothetical protein
MLRVIIVETSVFTRQIRNVMSDEEYHRLQVLLVSQPGLGALIPGGHGLRKLRWRAEGRGKRGGVRIIYYWAVRTDKILMLYVYPKNEQEDLTPNQLKLLRKIVEQEYP